MYLLLPLCLAAIGSWRVLPVSGTSSPPPSLNQHWSRQAAADYLDQREVWWQGWKPAQMDHGTLCISCHTAVPYVMARPALRRDLHEAAAGSPETKLIASVETRVNRWSEMVPFYSDAADGPGKTAQSHATEAVLNAVILTSYDQGLDHLRPVTRTALSHAWALQGKAGEQAGGWLWQDFHLAPWESSESAYQGAALLMLEVSKAPGGYAHEAGMQEPLASLQHYLQQHYAAQPLLNKLYVLWASAQVPGLLNTADQQALVKAMHDLQQKDGGWRVASLDTRERIDKTPNPAESDGYATALVLLALAAIQGGHQDASLQRGNLWLEQHQEKDGKWQTASLNKQRDPASNIGLFMSDAATGYAVLALDQAMSDARNEHTAGRPASPRSQHKQG